MNGDDLDQILETHQKREEDGRWKRLNSDRPNTIGACVIRTPGPSFHDIQALFRDENEQEAAVGAAAKGSEGAATCVICQDAIRTGAGTLSCGHSFHRSCIQDAIDHAYKARRLHAGSTTLPCPVCRAPFETKPWDAFCSARVLLASPAIRRMNAISGEEPENRERLVRVAAGSRLRRSETVHRGLGRLVHFTEEQEEQQRSPSFHPDPRHDFCAR